MFASVEYRSKVEIRINDGEGASILLAHCNDIEKARQIVDLMNESCQFTVGLTIKQGE